LDGGYILGGSTTSYGAGGYDMYLIKTDAAGDVVWTQTYGGTSTDVCYSLDQTIDGGYILGGYTTSFGAGWTDMYVLKIDALGAVEWERTYGGVSSEHCYSVKEVWMDYGYVLAGETMSYGAGINDFYVIRTDALGDTAWARTFGGPFNDICRSVDVTTDAGFAAAGWTNSFGAGLDDFYLVKIDHSCDMEWDMTFGGPEMDECYAILQTEDDGFLLGGITESYGAGEKDVYIIRLGPETARISGSVIPHLDGLTVYLMNEEDVLVASDTTLTEAGEYCFDDLAPGTYYVTLIEPLGFEADQNDVEVYLPGGLFPTVNFNLTTTVNFNDARPKPYWRHEILGNYYNVGRHDYTSEELLEFYAEIFDHFYNNPLNPIQIEGVTYFGSPARPPETMDELMQMLLPNDLPDDEQSCAERQLNVLMLNVVAEKVGQYFPASDDNAVVSQAIVYANDLLGVNNLLAQQICDELNRASRVAAGVIPLTTPIIIFTDEVETLNGVIPISFKFNAPVPNPFNPTTTLSYTLPTNGNVELTVFNAAGQQLAEVVNGYRAAGEHSVLFDAATLPSGVYFARLIAGDHQSIQKLLLVK
ncbi:T9SS type A sorting domain-containing protein, partial [bacterium]|nr:T9SS type A sorting domain-containing protein [bacterium]